MDMDNGDRIKEPSTFQEQVDILKERNLQIWDEQQAREILGRINYYRLSAYMLTYKVDNKFQDGISFGDIYDLYEFDKKLRNLIMGLLETIEVTFRTHIAYLIAHKYGATGYMNPENFITKKIHVELMDKLYLEIDRSDELFIKHHKSKYKGIFPVWVAIEVVSFGLLSKIYSNLKNEDKLEIAITYYKIPYKYIRSWLHALSTFRNICAHFGRVYNRTLTIKPMLHKKDLAKDIKNDTVFSLILIMGKLIKDDIEWGTFVTNLWALIDQYEKVDVELMGFPEKWEHLLRSIERQMPGSTPR